MTPALWRPRTYAVPTVPTTYGSSLMHSSTRPQRGSRTTSSTGASPWWMPSLAMLSPIAAPIRSTRSGSKLAPHDSGVGKVAAFQAARPVRHSSWTIAGMPRRVFGSEPALGVPEPRRAGRRLDRAGAEDPGEVAEPVRGERLELRRVVSASSRPATVRPPRRPRSREPRGRRSARASPPTSSAPAGPGRGRWLARRTRALPLRQRGRLHSDLLSRSFLTSRSARPSRPLGSESDAGSALDGALQPADDPLLHRQEEDQGGDHRERREGEDARGVLGVLGGEAATPSGSVCAAGSLRINSGSR